MQPSRYRVGLAVLMLVCGVAFGQPLQRVANTTLRLPPLPPVFGYVTTNAFGNLTFTDPVAIVSPPGETNRLFIVEQRGRVAVITNLAAPNRTVFLDISSRIAGGVPSDERGLLGMAFHPGYATNRFFYVYYSLVATTPEPGGTNSQHQRVAQFQTTPTNANQALSNSEVPLLTMYDQAGNHNGGDVHFGPDGYLYVSLGDEGNQMDSLNNGQRIDKDFWSGILRLDVDQRPGSLPPNLHPAISTTNYAIPPDNPFVGATSFNGASVNPTNVRTEFYAVGMRNPWRFSFDPVTGLLYCGDVGQDTWEEVDIVVKGGNYGWAYREATNAGPKAASAPPGFTSINPIATYRHGSATNQGNSVTGGVVYRGTKIPSLYGYYVFADYVSGNIWALRYDVTNTTPFVRIAFDASISAFGIDPANGDVLIADQDQDTIKRLVYLPVSGPPFPPTLADTGAFTNLLSLTTHSGFYPYDLNVPFWSDNANKTRWFYIPPSRQITFRASNNWTFPTGAVWIKHFELELTNGVPESRRRLETRFIVRDSATGVYGVTYRWGDSLTNAMLVPDEGMDETFAISDGGTMRTQVWHYPSRQECLRCHTSATFGGLALGFNTPQLNRDFDYGGVIQNQIRALNNAGYFTGGPSNIHTLRALAHPTNEAYSVEYRVRSCLAANCSPCHQPGGPGLGNFDARISRPQSALGLIHGPLLKDLGNTNARVVVPGSLANSMLLTRISTPGTDRMPPLDSTVLDTQAIALLSRWITNDLPRYESFTNWQLGFFNSTNATNALALADADGDGAANYLEYLTGTDPRNPADAWKIDIQQSGEMARILYPQIANRGFEVECTTNLFVTNSWRAVDVLANRPFFSASNLQAMVEDSITNAPAKFYRVRVYEP